MLYPVYFGPKRSSWYETIISNTLAQSTPNQHIVCPQILKYCIIVLRADDNGNGGAFALYAQLKRAVDIAADTQSPAAPEGPPAHQQPSDDDVFQLPQDAPLPADLHLAAYSHGQQAESKAHRSWAARITTTTLRPNGWRSRLQVWVEYSG